MDTRLLMNFEKIENPGHISVTRRTIYKNCLTRIHWHNYYEMEIVASGTLLHHVNGKDEILTRGSAYLLSPYDYHSLKADRENVEIINISFSPESPDIRVSGFLEHLGKVTSCTFTNKEMQFVDSKISLLEKELTCGENMAEIMACALLSEILIYTLRCANCNFERTVPALVQKALAYVNASFRGDISLNSLAESLNVSPGYLGKAMSKSIGKTFNEYLCDIRLKYACNLLESSSMSIKEISETSGFNSTTYFLYVFKKRFGISPGEYKKNITTMQLYGG
jgi:AraC-like DNA-binding protein/quercetin dioxygenase-like cupin family protein